MIIFWWHHMVPGVIAILYRHSGCHQPSSPVSPTMPPHHHKGIIFYFLSFSNQNIFHQLLPFFRCRLLMEKDCFYLFLFDPIFVCIPFSRLYLRVCNNYLSDQSNKKLISARQVVLAPAPTHIILPGQYQMFLTTK